MLGGAVVTIVTIPLEQAEARGCEKSVTVAVVFFDLFVFVNTKIDREEKERELRGHASQRTHQDFPCYDWNT